MKEESFEEFAVEYPAEQFVPYAFGVTDSYSLVPTSFGDAAIPGASAGGFGLLQGAGTRRYRDYNNPSATTGPTSLPPVGGGSGAAPGPTPAVMMPTT